MTFINVWGLASPSYPSFTTTNTPRLASFFSTTVTPEESIGSPRTNFEDVFKEETLTLKQKFVSYPKSISTETSDALVSDWDGDQCFSDLVAEGLESLDVDPSNLVMLYESPSSFSHETSFFNGNFYKYADYPPAGPVTKSVMGPRRSRT